MSDLLALLYETHGCIQLITTTTRQYITSCDTTYIIYCPLECITYRVPGRVYINRVIIASNMSGVYKSLETSKYLLMILYEQSRDFHSFKKQDTISLATIFFN